MTSKKTNDESVTQRSNEENFDTGLFLDLQEYLDPMERSNLIISRPGNSDTIFEDKGRRQTYNNMVNVEMNNARTSIIENELCKNINYRK